MSLFAQGIAEEEDDTGNTNNARNTNIERNCGVQAKGAVDEGERGTIGGHLATSRHGRYTNTALSLALEYY